MARACPVPPGHPWQCQAQPRLRASPKRNPSATFPGAGARNK
eukprot:gene14553-biopygen5122